MNLTIANLKQSDEENKDLMKEVLSNLKGWRFFIIFFTIAGIIIFIVYKIYLVDKKDRDNVIKRFYNSIRGRE